MIENIFYFLIISFFCLVWGMPLLYSFSSKATRTATFDIEKIILSFFVGLSALSLLSAWVSIFTGVQFYVLLIISPLWLYAWKTFFMNLTWRPKVKGLISGQEIFFITAVLLLFFTLSADRPVLEDNDLYHTQSIKWIHDYGTVPGLANLYLRYGFYTNWFRLISLFQLPIGPQNFLYLNNALCIWFFVFLFYQYKHFSSQATTLFTRHLQLYYLILILYFLFEWDLFRVASSSTSYDFVITVYILLVLHLLIQLLSQKDDSSQLHFCLLLFLATLPFFKISGFLAGAFLLVYLIIAKPRIKLFVFFVIVGLAGLIPFIIINYIQTGYPFFPYTLFNFSEPDWQVPKLLVERFNNYISIHNLYINQSPPMEAWQDNSSFSYFHNWFLHLTRPDQLLFILSAFALPVAPFLYKRLYPTCYTKLLLILSACYCMIVAWLILSPDPRFSFATLLFTSMFTIAGLFYHFSKNWMQSAALAFTTLAMFIYTASKWQISLSAKQVFQTKTVLMPPHQRIFIKNITFNIPEIINGNWNQRCYDTPLPCIYEVNPLLEPRGEKIEKGFRMTAMPNQQFVETFYY